MAQLAPRVRIPLYKDLLDRKAFKVYKVFKALLVQQGHKARKVILAQQVRQVLRVKLLMCQAQLAQ
jgi:hypothetical protein